MAFGEKHRWMLMASALALTIFRTAAAVEPPTAPTQSWDDRVNEVTNVREYLGAHWGMLVVDTANGQVVFERNADQLFCPASVTKLFTTAAALIDLGADHRFKTPVVRRGEIKDGVLQGDLILIAQGDLSLGGRTGPDGSLLFEESDHSYGSGQLVATDPLAGLIHLAREVQSAGIRSVTGDVIVDDRLFESAESTGSGPKRISPAIINDNLIDVIITPGLKPGEPARVRLVPETTYLAVDPRVETIKDPDESATIRLQDVGPRKLVVRGTIAVGQKPVAKTYEVEDPAGFARALFVEMLRQRGVDVAGSPLGENRADKLPPEAETKKLPVIAEYTSPPLTEYIRVILKVSQNLHASTLPLILAAKHGSTSLDRGLRIESEILDKLGVDVKTLSFGGGAGGSRSDLATPRATVALLRGMMKRPDFMAYQSALPILGRDGTLAKAVPPESPAKGHVYAKTGSYWVDNPFNGHSVLTSKALAGYMETASGRKLAFAFFVNDVPSLPIAPTVSEAAAAAGRKLGKLCEVFYADNVDAGTTLPTPASKPAEDPTRGDR